MNALRPSIKNNQAHLSKLKWLKPIVKVVGSDTYGNYYNTINSQKIVECPTKQTCNVGYTKDLSLPSYAIYQQTTLLQNKCIPLPLSLQHLPLAGNGLCGLNPG